MPKTNIRGAQILDSTVQRDDVDIVTVGQSLIRKAIPGAGITISSTGADTGTGDVTVNVSPTAIQTALIDGSAGASGTLTLRSTSHATKGKILFGTSAYDEVNNRLGIGTASPLANLDMMSNTSPQFQVRSSGTSPRVRIYGGSSSDSITIVEFWKDGTPTKATAVGMSDPGIGTVTDDLIFSAYTGAGWFERMRLTNGGNVGIGTISPTNILSLGGNVVRTIWMERHTTANTAGNNLKFQSGGAKAASTDKAGGDLIFETGIGTGNSIPAKIYFKGLDRSGTSGTGDRSLVNRIAINGSVNLTSAVAATIVTATTATLQGSGGHIIYTVFATDGVDVITSSGQVAYSVSNKAGTRTTSTSVLGTEATAKTDVVDTVVNAWSVGAASDNIQITSTITGMTPTTFRITYLVVSNSQQDFTLP